MTSDVRRELALELGPPLRVGVRRTLRGSAVSSPTSSSIVTLTVIGIAATSMPVDKYQPQVERSAGEHQHH
jgi:hypothetical protein